MVFNKRIIGADRLQVNMSIYDIETEFLSKVEEIESEIDQINKKIKCKEEKIKELEKKVEILTDGSEEIKGIEVVIEQVTDRFIGDSEANANNILAFYDKENEKLQATIKKLDGEIEEAKKVLQNALSSMYSSLDSAFYDDMNISASVDKHDVEPLCKDSIIGKTVAGDITDEEGNIIVKCGDEVNADLVSLVKKSNKIMELLSNI